MDSETGEQVTEQRNNWDHLAATALLMSGRIGDVLIKQRLDNGGQGSKMALAQQLRDIRTGAREIAKQTEKMIKELDETVGVPPAAEYED